MREDGAMQCPNCGRPGLDITAMGDKEPRYLGNCPCWPKPPACPSCRTSLDDGRCANMDCVIFGHVVPLPA